MPKVSVIVPAFNAAPYLPECLDSILAQTADDLEVICIDDGSTDGTPQILAEYALRDGRLGWVSQENRGLSESRNRGIDLSSGKYLLFCDADDMLKPDAVRALVEKAERDRLDVLFFGAAFGNHQREGHKCIVGNALAAVLAVKDVVVVQEP